MIYLLDTNTCINYLNGRAIQVLRRLQQTPVADVVVCSIVKAELQYGVRRSSNPQGELLKVEQFLAPYRSLAFDDQAAEHYGLIKAQLASQGNMIGPNDLLIAAIALSHRLTLVTHNTGEFGRIPQLMLDDWEATPP